MKFSILLPTNLPNGQPVKSTTREGILRLLWSTFGGCTVDAPSTGYWRDARGNLVKEPMQRVMVIVEHNSPANLEYARHLCRHIANILEQDCLFFEHNAEGVDVVEFIETPEGFKFSELNEPNADTETDLADLARKTREHARKERDKQRVDLMLDRMKAEREARRIASPPCNRPPVPSHKSTR